MGPQLQISATGKDSDAFYDTVILENIAYSADYQAPQTVITSAADYDQDTFDVDHVDYALAGHGRWVVVEGQRYFSPFTYVIGQETSWVPNRHGSWSWVEGDGWTWVSYDPWGWVTDHYGYWRNHADYGWIWSPFAGDDFRYRPHCVSWFHDDSHVAWYPYVGDYAAGYIQGANEGFTDGYWQGYEAARGYGAVDFAFSLEKPSSTVSTSPITT